MTRQQKLTIGAIIAVIAAAIAGIAIWQALTPDDHAHEDGIYYCPMHPTVTSDKPGSCPICGMALVKRAAPASTDPAAAQLAGSGSIDPSIARISLSPEQRVTANVRTMRVALDTHTGELITTGRVTIDERRVAQITAYAAGRIERLFVNFTGDTVRRGQAVAAIYSPDLFATQQEYLLALANRDRMRQAGFAGARSASQDLVESTRRRLILFGMTPAQIQTLEQNRKPFYATTIVSPVAGVVTQKLVVPQQYVTQGQPLLEVVDLSMVWVEADVYEQQLPGIHIGQSVTITTPAIPGIEFPGTVSFIQPFLAGETRTARVRVELANPNFRLKPDMYVSALIIGPPAPAHIMVPKTAVVDRGQSRFVWVETTPGTYQPREVTTGERHGDSIVIQSGLSGGENVVVEGAFLLDSEAQLRGATAGAAARATSTAAPADPHQGH
ncbi:MAG TPA: efflux RND transporter periplasmic adaptor subunit [Thermoanaerobaculia bacterium]|nr:efflux RND transporter periplasmic adaptor subunit [Thermoanaerobaculia bacterium]